MNNQKNQRKQAIYNTYVTTPLQFYTKSIQKRKNVKILNKIPQRKTVHNFYSSSANKNELRMQDFQKEDFMRKTNIMLRKVNVQHQPRKSCEEISDVGSLRKRDDSKQKKKKISVKKLLNRKSPYLANSNQFQIEKITRLLHPVSGPNQSLKLSIKKHNTNNIKNAQQIIRKHNVDFHSRMKAYVGRLSLPQNTKIFVMNSKDSHIRKALIDRGWVESSDLDSMFYHLKWVYNDNVSDYGGIMEGQFYNHFRNNQELTNKNLLRKNIKKAQIKQRPNIPLSYDLQNTQDYNDFCEAFQKYRSLVLFNNIISEIRQTHAKIYTKVSQCKLYNQNKRKSQFPQIDINHSQSNRQFYNKLLLKNSQNLSKSQIESYELFYDYISYISSIVSSVSKIRYSIFSWKKKKSDSKFKMISKLEQELFYGGLHIINNLTPFYLTEIIKLEKQICKIYMQNYGMSNIWILKPTGVSRGSGIMLTNDFNKIGQSRYGKIIQKYIENPLILQCGRKFDIRQWVLVKKIYPLQFYIFQSCYCRFSSVKYTSSDYSNLTKHLTNYSLNKQSYSRNKINQIKNHPIPESSVMSQRQLSLKITPERWKYIKQEIYINIFKTLSCCQDEVVQRNGCFEVYGFDVILDNNYKPWVLEVNMSPACQARQSFLDEDLEKMAEGVMGLIQGSDQIKNWIKVDQQLINTYEQTKLKQKQLSLQNASANKIQSFIRSKFH